MISPKRNNGVVYKHARNSDINQVSSIASKNFTPLFDSGDPYYIVQ